MEFSKHSVVVRYGSLIFLVGTAVIFLWWRAHAGKGNPYADRSEVSSSREQPEPPAGESMQDRSIKNNTDSGSSLHRTHRRNASPEKAALGFRSQTSHVARSKRGSVDHASTDAAMMNDAAAMNDGSKWSSTNAPREYVQASVEAIVPYLQDCYREFFEEGMRPNGTVNVTFLIEAAEKETTYVESVTLDANDPRLSSGSFQTCFVENIRTLEFERPPGDGSILVSYPFALSEE